MKNKGFTLIELLAIIVILAIIAVITVPIILGIIEDASENAAKDSAYGYKDAIDKYYMTANLSNSEIKMNGTYSINNGIVNGAYMDDVEIPVSGKVPTSGYLTYNNNILESGCLVVDEYQLIYNNGRFLAMGKGNCLVDADFATDSWSKIKINLRLDRNAYDEQIGDEKEIEIDGTSYTVRLANTASCPDNWPTTASQTTCGVVIEFVDTIIDTGNNDAVGHVMNSATTNAGGWPASDMYDFVNTTIFNKLPNELKADGMILTTKTVSGRESGKTSNYTSNDKLYLLSCIEVYGGAGSDCTYDSVKLVSENVTDGTRQLEYYGKQNPRRSKSTPAGAGNAWWLRSARSNSESFFLSLSQGGGSSSNISYNTNGVAPAFRIMD